VSLLIFGHAAGYAAAGNLHKRQSAKDQTEGDQRRDDQRRAESQENEGQTAHLRDGAG
jgi:hypothetical protein